MPFSEPFPSRKAVLNQLFILVGFATVALASTHFFLLEKPSEMSLAQPVTPHESRLFDTEVRSEPAGVNWNDVNLSSGQAISPESEVKTARSNMLSDFEAR